MKNLIFFLSLFFWLIACNNTDKTNNDNNSDTLISEETEVVELIEEETVVKINESDSLALLALYNSTNGKNWKNRWDLTKPHSRSSGP